MYLSQIIDEYLMKDGNKSGLLMSKGKCVYFYGEKCCEAVCHLISINGDISEYVDELFIMKNGTTVTLYRNFRRVLQLEELIAVYSILLPEGELNGIITSGQRLNNAEMLFTDGRIADFVKYLITGNSKRCFPLITEFQALEQAVSSGQAKALTQLNSCGRFPH